MVAMLDGETHDLRSEAESLIGWWRDAGVDVLIDEEPRNWLAEAEVATAKSAPSLPVAPAPKTSDAGAPLVLPSTLSEFLHGWRPIHEP